jgi:hypothetical protein
MSHECDVATSVLVKMIGKDTLEETDKRDGKIIGVPKVTVATDGMSAKIVYDDELRGSKTEYVAMKQQRQRPKSSAEQLSGVGARRGRNAEFSGFSKPASPVGIVIALLLHIPNI